MQIIIYKFCYTLELGRYWVYFDYINDRIVHN